MVYMVYIPFCVACAFDICLLKCLLTQAYLNNAAAVGVSVQSEQSAFKTKEITNIYNI